MTTALLAGVAAATAVWLLVWSPTLPTLPTRPGAIWGLGRAAPFALAALAATTSLALVGGTRGAVLVIGLGCVGGVARSVARGRADRIRAARRSHVVEVGEAMVGELRAGQPPTRALARAADVWPELAPVVAASRLGADLPSAMRQAAGRPGAESLADLAAAWQVAERSGAGLSVALGQVVASARGRQLADALVAGELASARATARLVAALPVGTLAMSAGIGGDPWSFLLDSPVGVALLGAGVGLIFVGLAWIDRIAGSVTAR